MKAIDRSKVEFEVYPGAANLIAEMVERCGGWRCEDHPSEPLGHDGCAGPGMLIYNPEEHE